MKYFAIFISLYRVYSLVYREMAPSGLNAEVNTVCYQLHIRVSVFTEVKLDGEASDLH